jgi:hypothetical protein
MASAVSRGYSWWWWVPAPPSSADFHAITCARSASLVSGVDGPVSTISLRLDVVQRGS